jgi:hypothetical protein
MIELALALLMKGLGTICFAILLAIGFGLGNKLFASMMPVPV